MNAPHFIPIFSNQCDHLTTLLHSIAKHENWAKINSYFNGIFTESINNADSLRMMLHLHGNAYYNHLLHKLRADSRDQAPTPPVTLDQRSVLYRFIWLHVKNNTPTILSKGSTWHRDEVECRQRGEIYKPSIDYLDSGDQPYIFLSVESLCACQFGTAPHPSCHPCRSHSVNSPHVLSPDYPNRILGDKTVVKLPWVIKSPPTLLHIFYISNEDEWFYSAHSELSLAYQEYLHR